MNEWNMMPKIYKMYKKLKLNWDPNTLVTTLVDSHKLWITNTVIIWHGGRKNANGKSAWKNVTQNSRWKNSTQKMKKQEYNTENSQVKTWHRSRAGEKRAQIKYGQKWHSGCCVLAATQSWVAFLRVPFSSCVVAGS